ADQSPANHTSGHSASDQYLSRHTSPDTTITNSSSTSRFIYPPPTRTLRAGDSSSELSTKPSRKRCRSSATIMPSYILVSRALVPTHVDLLPPRKRFRDSYSPEDSVEEDIDADVLEDIELGQKELEARSFIAGGERAGLLDCVAALKRSNARLQGILRMESARVDRYRYRMSFMAVRSGRSVDFVTMIGHVAPKVRATTVASSARVLELDTHSSSKADPSEISLPPVPVEPMVSPFLCSNNTESDTKMSERRVSSKPNDAMLARWKSRVASRSSSPTTSTLEFPTAPIPPVPYAIVAPSTDIVSPIDAPLEIHRRRAILI
nr:hypothetical protein [Tanacetum cinerariifolium]